MSSTEKAIDGLRKIQDGMNVLSGGPANWYLERLAEQSEEFFRRCSPCKKGDRVALIKTPYIAPDSDWQGSKHFLRVESVGTVQSVDFFKGKFFADIVFDNESWIDKDGFEQLVSQKHTYGISEDLFRVIRSEPITPPPEPPPTPPRKS